MSAITLTKENVMNQLQNGVTLIDFWASWCGPCHVQLPIVNELADEVKGKYTVATVNVDQEPELAAAFRVRGIPALFIVKDGKIVDQMTGVQHKDILKEKLLRAGS